MWTLSGFADEIDPDLQTQCDVLKELGIRYVEFRSAWDINVLDLDDDQIDEAAAILASNKLSVSSIGSPIGKINIEDDFDAHVVRMERALTVARRLKAPYIRVFSFFLRPDQPPEVHRDEVIRRMRVLAEMAQTGRRGAAAREREGNIRGHSRTGAGHRRVGEPPQPETGLGCCELCPGGGDPLHRRVPDRCDRTPCTSRSRMPSWRPVRWCPRATVTASSEKPSRRLPPTASTASSRWNRTWALRTTSADSPDRRTSSGPPRRSPASCRTKDRLCMNDGTPPRPCRV